MKRVLRFQMAIVGAEALEAGQYWGLDCRAGIGADPLCLAGIRPADNLAGLSLQVETACPGGQAVHCRVR